MRAGAGEEVGDVDESRGALVGRDVGLEILQEAGGDGLGGWAVVGKGHETREGRRGGGKECVVGLW